MNLLTRAGATLGAVAVALGLSQAASAALATAAEAPHITWENCPKSVDKEGAQCGRIDVPTYYDNPEAGTISVGFVKVPAANPAARRGSLFLNPGGPGGDAYGYAGNTGMPFPEGMTNEWDLIGVQPRGLPGSTPVSCTQPGGSEIDAIFRAGAYTQASCEKDTPGYTKSLTTYNTARDWDMVRWALGEERISILGTSYGTYLGSAYATMFPNRTDRLVLDSAMSTKLAWNGILESQMAGYDMAYHDFFSYVAANDAEYHLGTTPLAVYQRWSQKVQSEVGVRPTVLPPNAQIGDLPPGLSIAGQPGADLMTATGKLRVNAEFLGDRITHPNGTVANSPTFMLLRGIAPAPVQWPQLARHIAGQEDMSKVLSGGDLSEQEQKDLMMQQIQAQNMQNLIMCNENQAPGNVAYLPELLWSQFVTGDPSALITAFYASGTACSGMAPVTKPVALDGSALAVQPLQISATRDPQTPYQFHGDTARAMRAHVVTVHGPGHGQVGTGNKAVDDVVVEYLRTGHTGVTDVPGLH